MQQTALEWNALDAPWLSERARLVALCARLSGSNAAAEDLAQETLLEAWRHRDALRDPDRLAPWLSGIARNVCLRWRRMRSRDTAYMLLAPNTAGDATPAPAWDDLLAGDADLEIELERHELAALLDRALALLPPETRSALLAHYIEQMPLAELAAHLGAEASAVAMRLRRGKLALRRVLTTEMGDELATHAPDLYVRHSQHEWEATPLWCVTCGRHHLLGRYDVAGGELWLRCPACSPDPALLHIHTQALGILAGVRGYRRAYGRVLNWGGRYYHAHLRERRIPCPSCGRLLPRGSERPHYTSPSPLGNDLGVRLLCPDCDLDNWESLDGLALITPEGRAFQRRHPRIRTLPHEYIEAEGRPAVVARFESIGDAGRLAVVADAETLEPLRIESSDRAEGLER